MARESLAGSWDAKDGAPTILFEPLKRDYFGLKLQNSLYIRHELRYALRPFAAYLWRTFWRISTKGKQSSETTQKQRDSGQKKQEKEESTSFRQAFRIAV